MENPFWIHFGAGNIFCAFQANVVQSLLNEGILDRVLIVADGNVEKTGVGSVMESCILDSEDTKEYGRLKEIFRKGSLQMVSFMTESYIGKVAFLLYTRYLAGFKLGEDTDVESALKPVLENAKIFGVNLYEVGMADKVCRYFKEVIAGTGAVRETLKRYTA